MNKIENQKSSTPFVKRLLTLSSFVNEEEIEIIARLVALCGLLEVEEPKDRHLLGIFSEISPDEIVLLQMVDDTHKKFTRRTKEWGYQGHRDAAVGGAERRAWSKFFSKGKWNAQSWHLFASVNKLTLIWTY